MDFFDLRQTGEQIQFILDSFQEISDEFNTVKQEVANMPLVKISNATAYNLNNITTPKRLEQLCIRIIEKILLYNKIGYID